MRRDRKGRKSLMEYGEWFFGNLPLKIENIKIYRPKLIRIWRVALRISLIARIFEGGWTSSMHCRMKTPDKMEFSGIRRIRRALVCSTAILTLFVCCCY